MSGTGKTTLSSDLSRQLIGMMNMVVFNFEGGCCAKCINLLKEKEPQIFSAIKTGTLLENMTFFDDTKTVNYGNASITEIQGRLIT